MTVEQTTGTRRAYMEAMPMPIRRQPIIMDTRKPGDTWVGMWTATEGPAAITAKAAVVVVAIAETKVVVSEITIANDT